MQITINIPDELEATTRAALAQGADDSNEAVTASATQLLAGYVIQHAQRVAAKEAATATAEQIAASFGVDLPAGGGGRERAQARRQERSRSAER